MVTASFRVAILGGGIAGASLLRALLDHPHIDVHIFESAPEFKESGAAIGLPRNGLEALELLSPSTAGCLERAGAVAQQGVRQFLAEGESQGALVDEVDAGDGQRLVSIVHRAAFLRELLSGADPSRMHASKKLDRLEKIGPEGPLVLRFTDETTHECDIAVGADGIHSTVRRIILGEQDPAAHPRNSGHWCVMALQPYDQAVAAIGDTFVDADDAREYQWIGDGTYMLHNILNDGHLVQVIAAAYDHHGEGSDAWHRKVAAKDLRDLFKNWPPNLRNVVEKLLCSQDEHSAMYLWEHPPARTYASGPVCIIGDAAHATTPWQGSGGSMSLEDSLILSSLLGQCKDASQAVIALEVYDQARRPRTQRIVESSRGTGEIMTGRDKSTGLDLSKLYRKLIPRWDFIVNFDNKKAREEALRVLSERLAVA